MKKLMAFFALISIVLTFSINAYAQYGPYQYSETIGSYNLYNYNYGWNQPYNYGRGQLYIYDPDHDYGISNREPLLTAAGDPGHFRPPNNYGWCGPLSNFVMNQPFDTFLTFSSDPFYPYPVPFYPNNYGWNQPFNPSVYGPRPYSPLEPYIPDPDWYQKGGYDWSNPQPLLTATGEEFYPSLPPALRVELYLWMISEDYTLD